MAEPRRKPTRSDLLVIVARLHGMVTDARNAFDNDQCPTRAETVRGYLTSAETLCLDATEQDPPIKLAGPWSDR